MCAACEDRSKGLRGDEHLLTHIVPTTAAYDRHIQQLPEHCSQIASGVDKICQNDVKGTGLMLCLCPGTQGCHGRHCTHGIFHQAIVQGDALLCCHRRYGGCAGPSVHWGCCG